VQENPYLGVIISENLKWSTYINKICNKANSTLGFIRRNLKHCNRKFKETAYISLVRSLFDYSSTVWDAHLQKDIDRIENVQRGAARFIYSDNKRTSSVTAMMNELVWKPLNERRKEQRLFLLFKIVNDLVAIPAENNIEYNQRPSRTSNNKQTKVLSATPEICKILSSQEL
jgi:predicted amidophosphoribosyltransferase